MKGYQVIGHAKTLAPEHCNSRTLSDGLIFLELAQAKRYAKEEMHPGANIREWENPTYYYDPIAVEYVRVATGERIRGSYKQD